MLDVEYIRNNKVKVQTSAKNKNREVDIDGILSLDEKRRELMVEVQKLREERNKNSKTKPSPELIEAGKRTKEKIQILDEKLAEIDSQLNLKLSQVPNIPLDDVPVGKDENDNVEIYKRGEIPKFTFEPKSHIDLAKDLDLIDFDRGSKVSGYRGYFLKNQLAQLNFALLFYSFQKLVAKGYTPLFAPSIVKAFTLFGNGQFPWGEAEVYKLNDEDAYLAGTAEVAVTSYYANETLNEKDLPKKFVAFSPCFRREIGSYGKDTKGVYRVHEFFKIEQVILSKADIDDARALHQELQKNCEEILDDLKLPYHVLFMCTGDMGEPQVYKYDTEVWMPSRGGYGETMSNSIMGDFQSRRLNIKYKNKNGDSKHVFTLNNTAIASPRILVAILENFQQADGSIGVPKVLQGLLGFDEIAKD